MPAKNFLYYFGSELKSLFKEKSAILLDKNASYKNIYKSYCQHGFYCQLHFSSIENKEI